MSVTLLILTYLDVDIGARLGQPTDEASRAVFIVRLEDHSVSEPFRNLQLCGSSRARDKQSRRQEATGEAQKLHDANAMPYKISKISEIAKLRFVVFCCC